jgi:hypothetical protein
MAFGAVPHFSGTATGSDHASGGQHASSGRGGCYVQHLCDGSAALRPVLRGRSCWMPGIDHRLVARLSSTAGLSALRQSLNPRGDGGSVEAEVVCHGLSRFLEPAGVWWSSRGTDGL